MQKRIPKPSTRGLRASLSYTIPSPLQLCTIPGKKYSILHQSDVTTVTHGNLHTGGLTASEKMAGRLRTYLMNLWSCGSWQLLAEIADIKIVIYLVLLLSQLLQTPGPG